jgi:uncharacterized membrane protein YdbT with pleckstrin-like domain
MTDEKTIWRGSSSPIVYFGFFFVCGGASVLLIGLCIVLALEFGTTPAVVCGGLVLVPVMAGAVKLVVNQCRVYEVTTERIRVTTGVFSKTSQELELYRVKDLSVVQPFVYRVNKCGNIVLTTNDASSPTLMLEAVPHLDTLREELRRNVELCRDQKRVRLAELE